MKVRTGNIWIDEKGVVHEEDSYLVWIRDTNGEWYFNGKKTTVNLPTYIRRNCVESYFRNGKKHRVDGPAHIGHYVDEYWIDGKPYNKAEFNAHPEVIKYRLDRIIEEELS